VKSLPLNSRWRSHAGGVDETAEKAAVARSPELGVDCSGEVLLVKKPWDRKSKAKTKRSYDTVMC